MDKSNSNTSNLDSNYNFQNSFNDEENSLNSFKDSINHKNGSKDIQLDFIDTGISNHKKEDFIDNNKILNDNQPKTHYLGKKKKRIHDKFAKDNIIKKIKSTLLNYLFNFINLVIYNRYNGNIGHDVLKKQLLKIDKTEMLPSKNNKVLLNKTLKEIFSGDFSIIYSKSYNEKHNKDVIDELLNDENKERRDFFNKLFNLTLIDCLNHLRGKYIEQLHGFASLNDILKKYENDYDYIKELNYYFLNFEEIIGKSRIINK
jgi:hypothetical protein